MKIAQIKYLILAQPFAGENFFRTFGTCNSNYFYKCGSIRVQAVDAYYRVCSVRCCREALMDFPDDGSKSIIAINPICTHLWLHVVSAFPDK